jgi:hypothetical protein
VRGELAGKKARCTCGAVVLVPLPAASQEARRGDEVDRAFAPIKKPGPRTDRPQEETAIQPAAQSREVVSQPEPAAPRRGVRRILAAIPPLKKWKPKKSDPWPGRVAVACVAYGIIAILAIPIHAAMTAPHGLFAVCIYLFRMCIAGAIVVSGVLLARGDRNGPAWAGVSCLLFCAFPTSGEFSLLLLIYALPAWDLLVAFHTFMSGGPLLGFLLALLIFAALYGLPIAITVWSLKREAARTRREEEEMPE